MKFDYKCSKIVLEVMIVLKRELYLNKILPFIDTELIKVVTGIRRSGKSVMLELIQNELLARGVSKEQILTMNFEKMENCAYTKAELLHAEVMRRVKNITGKAYLFLDEIQEVENWEKCINSLRLDIDCDIYITGSNAKLLSGELATYLSGRYVEFVIYPFSFNEFLQIQEKHHQSIADSFKQYLTWGGMPYLNALNYSPEPSTYYLQDLYNTVELKDIIKRNNIRDVDLLERIMAYLTVNAGTAFTATSIVKYFKSEGRRVSLDTVLNYIKAATDAFLFYRIPCEDLPGKRILAVDEKYYIVDQGLREAVFGNNMRVINLMLENIVCLELLRRGYKVTSGRVNKREIDFIGTKQGERVYIQVSYLLASEETITREFAPFYQLADNYPKYVVTLDEFDMSQDGIKHCNIRDFLLQENW